MTAIGFLAGSIHVFSGPDHLAAIAPLATRPRQKPWRVGLVWGLGHSFGVVIIGWLIHVLRDMAVVESISAGAEKLVGLALIAVGIWTLRAWRRKHSESHSHEPISNPARHSAAFSVGILHGIAGASHLAALLPLTAIDEPKSVGWTKLQFAAHMEQCCQSFIGSQSATE